MLVMRSNNVAGRHTHTHTHTYGEAVGGCAMMLARAIARGGGGGLRGWAGKGDRGIAGLKTGPLSWWRHGGLGQLLDCIHCIPSTARRYFQLGCDMGRPWSL